MGVYISSDDVQATSQYTKHKYKYTLTPVEKSWHRAAVLGT